MKAPAKRASAPKRARIDSGTGTARTIAARVYTDTFLADLQRQFGFDATSPETAARIRDLARRYILGRRTENQPDFLKTERRAYLAIQEATERYLALLKDHEDRDLAADMDMAARQSGWERPETAEPERLYRQLLRLLDLLRNAAIQQARHLESHGGRPKNFGLGDLVRHAAHFWTGTLGRQFSIDYHQGAGTTPAFDFVKALVVPIDDVSDQQIVTAMRAEIAKRNSPGPAKPKRRLTRT
jgi:hypothetical protein